MAITTTAHWSWTTENPTGNVSYTIRYRLSGTSVWTQYSTSGTTAAVSGLAINRVYDFQITNVNNNDNPSSAISQGINITDPNPVISPVNTSVGYTFGNLSMDMDSYTSTVALQSNPGAIIDTHILSPSDTVTDTFTGLSALTGYLMTITPASGPFYKTFTYLFTTTASAACPAPHSVTAVLV